jgi:hypothetical protein
MNTNKNTHKAASVAAEVHAFILGMREFRQNETTHFEENLIEVYDSGRDFAHKLTFRVFDN